MTLSLSVPSSPAYSPDDHVQRIESSVLPVRRSGLSHRVIEDDAVDGPRITLGGRSVLNFGSCSYLGLETDPRLKQAACDAIGRYGVSFSSSRAYLSLPLYAEYESLVSEMVGGLPVVIAQTTSLAHIAALPVLVGDRDAVLFDGMVHSSVQAVLPALRARGVLCEMLPHNHVERLERRARALAETHERVFYLCDGVYSMHGDLAPIADVVAVLERVPSLFAYVDDTHGLGWAGRHGAGTVLGRGHAHPRMVVALGFSKAFSGGGAALVFPNRELADRVFTCGSTLISSGPVQPAQLGAGIASARIHLSPDIANLQRQLLERLAFFDHTTQASSIAPTHRDPAPIRFMEIGPEDTTITMAAELLDAGFFVNVALYPAVPRRRAGLRILLTRQQSFEDIEALVEQLELTLRGRKRLMLPRRKR